MWLLENGTFTRLEAGVKAGSYDLKQYDRFMAGDYSAKSGTDKTEKIGVIPVRGVLTQEPDFFAFLFGGGNTTYSSMISQISAFNNDSKVDTITLDIDSPGGEVNGLFEVFSAIQKSVKPIDVHISGMAASAAFGLAAQGRTVTASSIATMVGSVGVVQSFRVDDSVVDVTSREAPNKRKDASTVEGVEAIKDELDPIHNLFAGSIAKGRGTTIANVNKNFGRGGMVLATEAKDRGMIDCIAEGSFNIEPSKKESAQAGESTSSPILEKKMDIVKLEAEYPLLYAQVLKKGAIKGQADEADRVNAHITMGKQCSAQDIALTAIEDGSTMTNTLIAKYTSAGINANAQGRRVNDDPTVAAVVNDATVPTVKSEAEKVEDEAVKLFLNNGDLGEDFK